MFVYEQIWKPCQQYFINTLTHSYGCTVTRSSSMWLTWRDVSCSAPQPLKLPFLRALFIHNSIVLQPLSIWCKYDDNLFLNLLNYKFFITFEMFLFILCTYFICFQTNQEWRYVPRLSINSISPSVAPFFYLAACISNSTCTFTIKISMIYEKM